MDATTGISIGSRRGLGKVKHIHHVLPLGPGDHRLRSNKVAQSGDWKYAGGPNDKAIGRKADSKIPGRNGVFIKDWTTPSRAEDLKGERNPTMPHNSQKAKHASYSGGVTGSEGHR